MPDSLLVSLPWSDFRGQTHVMVSGQKGQVLLIQGFEPLGALPGFHFPEFGQGAIIWIAEVKRTGLGESQEIGPQLISSRIGFCAHDQGNELMIPAAE